MIDMYVTAVITLLIVWLVVGAWRLRSRRVAVGPAAAAMMDALHDQEKRAAVQIILEERTGQRDAEDRDGNLPELEAQTKPSRTAHDRLQTHSERLIT